MPLPREILQCGLGVVTALAGGAQKAAPYPIAANQPYQPDHQIVVPGNFEANRKAAGLPDFELKPFPQPEAQPTGETLAAENVTLLRFKPEADPKTLTYEIRKLGGTVTIELPGFGLIGNMPPTLQLTDPGVIEFKRTPFSPDELATLFTDPTHQRWAQAWNGLITQPYISAETLEETAQALVNDAFEVPPEEKPPQVTIQEVTTVPNFLQTSIIASGRVAVRIVTPESQGQTSTENWTTEELNLVMTEHFNAFHWLATRYPANLTFVVDPQSAIPIPVSVEPITLRQVDQGLWMAEALAAYGFTEKGYFYRALSQNNWLRAHHDTIWGFTIFVVDSSNDGDGYFADGYFAYAYLGGPFLVMTYGNNGYGPDNMDAVAAHETGHIFYALDQYYSAHQPCTAISGYLRVENQNSQYHPEAPCATDLVDIMRGLTYPLAYGYRNLAPAGVSPSGAGQLGWRDAWRFDCATNEWVPGQDGLLDPAGSLCQQTEMLPSGAISATLELKPLASAVLNGDSVLHVNTVLGAWARSGNQVFNPQEATLSPDSQTLGILIPFPPGTAPLDLCIGTKLQNTCQNLVPSPIHFLYLPNIQRSNSPPDSR